MVRRAPTIALSPEEQDARSEQGYAFRAQIVLMAAEGIQNKDIAAALGSPACTVVKWYTRFARDRIAGL